MARNYYTFLSQELLFEINLLLNDFRWAQYVLCIAELLCSYCYVFLLYDRRYGTTIPKVYLVEEVLDSIPNGGYFLIQFWFHYVFWKYLRLFVNIDIQNDCYICIRLASSIRLKETQLKLSLWTQIYTNSIFENYFYKRVFMHGLLVKGWPSATSIKLC